VLFAIAEDIDIAWIVRQGTVTFLAQTLSRIEIFGVADSGAET
jgi:hypothetical protein